MHDGKANESARYSQAFRWLAVPTPFDHDYRALIMPQVARMLRVHGYMVQLELELWSEAYDTCWRFAVSRGALHLSGHLARELAEWIECELLAATKREPDAGVLTREQFGRLTS